MTVSTNSWQEIDLRTLYRSVLCTLILSLVVSSAIAIWRKVLYSKMLLIYLFSSPGIYRDPGMKIVLCKLQYKITIKDAI